MDFIKNMGITPIFIYIYAVGGFMTFYLVAMVFYMRYKKNQGKTGELRIFMVPKSTSSQRRSLSKPMESMSTLWTVRNP